MSYEIILSPAAKKDILTLRKTSDVAVMKKLNKLLDELREHPTVGTGKPERLKHNLAGCWSRRITQEHRLVYRIEEDIVTVIVIRAHGHYTE
ncbi:MAG: Txe/YoeB family addiction module toxin [Prevotellaceae bacterium]|jgi:toxin YoeB|nr:Txe/YoeB family addiction module toxin [Prevotellaceae bacterium]